MQRHATRYKLRTNLKIFFFKYFKKVFFSFTRSINAALTYHTHQVSVKYVKTLLFSRKGGTIEIEFSDKSFQPTYMTWYKHLVAPLTRVIV